MKRINVMVSDEAKEIILKFQKNHNLSTLDETVNQYIIGQNIILE